MRLLPPALLLASLSCALLAAAEPDWRNLKSGLRIPDQGYCDQPYVVITREGHWLCTMTTGRGKEGDPGQHVVATISRDQGKSWSELIDIEPETGPEASWAVPLVTPAGRVYVFYDYNGDKISGRRADMLGWYVYRFSDDGGQSWSRERYRLPVRRTACDENNGMPPGVQLLWGIDKPMVDGGAAYFCFTKLGRYILSDGEGWMFRSDNLLTETDPARLHWQMLPDGDHGIRNPKFGSVQEEHNVVALPGGGLYCVYRTTGGFPATSISRDGGHVWSEPVAMTYGPGERELRRPRACPMLWRCSNGNYLFWFHNNGTKSFTNRNPVWITGGVADAGTIRWSEPELLFYDDNPSQRISYPDLIEQGGRYWFTETQKTEARVHEVPASLLEGLWRQRTHKEAASAGRVLELAANSLVAGKSAPLPRLGPLTDRGGFTLDLWLLLDGVKSGQAVLDARDASGAGLALVTGNEQNLELILSDGKNSAMWQSDPDTLKAGAAQHVSITVDSGPRIITGIIDGRLCDGGSARPQGWERFPVAMASVTGAGRLKIAPQMQGAIQSLRLYNRPLTTSESVGNYRAGLSR